MSLDTFKKALDDAHPTTGVTFVGLGEPLMNPDFYEMLVESKKRDLIINFATNGVWYACCLDSNNELEFGNLSESTILEVYNSYKRNSLIDRIKDKQFKSIGSPCDTVIACL
jgi:wyosine [tRNA(Phe)-imidazoG37] synthetase (radical SAM superfamily)